MVDLQVAQGLESKGEEIMDKELKTFYVGYRGYVTIYTPIEAVDEDDAYEKLKGGLLPTEPTENMELTM